MANVQGLLSFGHYKQSFGTVSLRTQEIKSRLYLEYDK